MMYKIIELSEQKGFLKWEQYPERLVGCSNLYDEIKVIRDGRDCPCLNFKIKCETMSYQTSYLVGLDWIVENKIAAWVKPKMVNGECQIDYMSMLMYALENIDNHKHLADLIHIQFDKPYIEVEQKNDDLSLFLVIQLLSLLRKLVQGGLMRSYYMVTEVLNSRIKGKLLVERDVKTNRVKGKTTNTCCRYQYYGYDSEENRILKKAFVFACQIVDAGHMCDNASLRSMIDYIRPAFANVSDVIEVNRVKYYKPNPLYPEYGECLRLSQLLLQRHSYSFKPASKEGVPVVATPPYWIDMSKLFELYVYQKLCEQFPSASVKYHERMNYQELDILFDDNTNAKYVIDAKYKPKYRDGSVSMSDIRQVCGYARMRSVYELLKVEQDKIIPSLIIYPTMDGEDLCRSTFYDKVNAGKDDRYIELYKCGIKLPILLNR